eukprot:3466125-Prymnesium_polylepis.1
MPKARGDSHSPCKTEHDGVHGAKSIVLSAGTARPGGGPLVSATLRACGRVRNLLFGWVVLPNSFSAVSNKNHDTRGA